MKKEILGPAIVVGLILVFIGVVYLEHSHEDASARASEANAALESQIRARDHFVDEQLMQTNMHIIARTFGNLEALKYRECHETPPQNPKHQKECEALEARVKL